MSGLNSGSLVFHFLFKSIRIAFFLPLATYAVPIVAFSSVLSGVSIGRGNSSVCESSWSVSCGGESSVSYGERLAESASCRRKSSSQDGGRLAESASRRRLPLARRVRSWVRQVEDDCNSFAVSSAFPIGLSVLHWAKPVEWADLSLAVGDWLDSNPIVPLLLTDSQASFIDTYVRYWVEPFE